MSKVTKISTAKKKAAKKQAAKRKTVKKVAKPADSFQRCYHTHPPLQIGEHTIYGGSCLSPAVKDADVYVGFDHNMSDDSVLYPWTPTEAVFFKIPDMGVPASIPEFKNLITWITMQLIAGKKVHMGCIGGHGRTGLVMSVLVNQIMQLEDSTTYVRQNYCKKAVESKTQINWLFNNFGIKKTEPTKGFAQYQGGGQDIQFGFKEDPTSLNTTPHNTGYKANVTEDLYAQSVAVKGQVWGKNK